MFGPVVRGLDFVRKHACGTLEVRCGIDILAVGMLEVPNLVKIGVNEDKVLELSEWRRCYGVMGWHLNFIFISYCTA